MVRSRSASPKKWLRLYRPVSPSTVAIVRTWLNRRRVLVRGHALSGEGRGDLNLRLGHHALVGRSDQQEAERLAACATWIAQPAAWRAEQPAERRPIRREHRARPGTGRDRPGPAARRAAGCRRSRRRRATDETTNPSWSSRVSSGRVAAQRAGQAGQQPAHHLVRVQRRALLGHRRAQGLGDVALPPRGLHRDLELGGAGGLQRHRDVVGDRLQDVDVVGGEHALGDPAVEVDDAEQLAVEAQRRDHDAAQAVDLHAVRAERRAFLAAGHHERFAGVPHPVDQGGAVAGQLVDVVAVGVPARRAGSSFCRSRSSRKR